VTPRDVDALRAHLRSASTVALRISHHLEDLHTLAFDRHVSGGERTSGGNWPPPGVEAVGDERARDLWGRLSTLARQVEMTLRALEWATGNLLAVGPSAEETRGSLILHQEYADALTRQRRRRTAGEYTPERMVDQPPHPRGGAR
jgi:hypothetical protein